MHIALSGDYDNPDFSPAPFTSLYQRSIYQYSRNLTGQVFFRLKKLLPSLPLRTQTLGHQLLTRKDFLLARLRQVLNLKITAMRTRCHGNYGLEELLFTGKDYVILDFEGEAYRTLNERRMKRSPLRDVAGMLLSFDYATRVALRNEVENGMIREENLVQMQQWSQFWSAWVRGAFLKSYLETAAQDSFLPKSTAELEVLLECYLLENAIQDLGIYLQEPNDMLDISIQLLIDFSSRLMS
jgi:maltose alpha-D-glucosyltransferase/alpha-amylase